MKQLARILVRLPQGVSNGANSLRASLGNAARRARLDTIPRQYRLVINWGNSVPVQHGASCVVLNKPSAISNAANKVNAFRLFEQHNISCPPWSESMPDLTDGKWMARTTITGHSGAGIVVMRNEEDKVEAPLYTKYIPKKEEYRLHVVDGKVIFVQQKRKQSNMEQTSDEKLIRSHANGWVYCTSDVEVTDEAQELAIAAVKALGLDFGAVDMIKGKDDGSMYVLEVNTAPGLASPTLLDAYTKAFLELL